MRKLRIKIAFIIIFSGLFLCAQASSSNSPALNFKKKSDISADTAKVNFYVRKAVTQVLKQQNLEMAKSYIDTAEMICVEDKIEFPSMLHLTRAWYFFLISDYRSASQEATIALNKSKNNGETLVQVKTMNFFGQYCLKTGFYQEGIDYFNESINIAKKNKLKGIIPKSYHGLADIYKTLGKQPEYRKNLKHFIEAAEIENDTMFMITGLWWLGSSYTTPEYDHRLADSLLRKCIEFSLAVKDTSFISRSLLNLGWNYYTQNNYDDALKYYFKSLIYSLPSKDYESSANSYGNIGTIYRDMGETNKSILYYNKSIENARLNEDLYTLSWVYMDMNEMYLRKKDTSNAYKSFVLYKKYSDENIKKTNSEGLTSAKVRYDADSHNKELQLLSLRLRNHKLLTYGYTGLFVLCLTILLLLLRGAKINAKRHISEMKRQISEIKQANLRQQMNPHFIFNTLNSIQYYMYQHDKLATNNYLTKFSNLMRKVLENSQHTSVPLRDELDALNLYLELEKIRFHEKFDYKINIDEEIDTLLYKVPTMLIQPYVENSITHGLMPGENKGILKIDLTLEKEYISCIIEDNGIGRDAAMKKKAQGENNHNSLGTQIVSSRLDLVNTLYGTSLKTIYTDLKNENGDPVGTRVEIQIPLLT
jgi:tetratricopeptide (TPR) repeat protein